MTINCKDFKIRDKLGAGRKQLYTHPAVSQSCSQVATALKRIKDSQVEDIEQLFIS